MLHQQLLQRNRLIVKRWGAEDGKDRVVFRPGGGEDGPAPTDDGWTVAGGTGTRTMTYVSDTDRGTVLNLTTTAGGPRTRSRTTIGSG